MAISEIDICNLALSKVGSDTIRSFTENNKRSRLCNIFYDNEKRYVLSQHDWSFARKIAQLDKIKTDSTFPEGYSAFQIPHDCETPRQVGKDSSRSNWEVVGNTIVVPDNCETSIILRYTQSNPEPYLFTQSFVDLVALRIAAMLSQPLAQDKGLMSSMMQAYASSKYDAWESDANIGNIYRDHQENPDDDKFSFPDGGRSPSNMW